MNDYKMIFAQLVPALPGMIVFAIGLVMSVAKFQESPRAYLWSAIGTAILLAQRLVQIVAFGYFLPRYVASASSSSMKISQIYSVIGLVFGVIGTAGIICIVVAVFVGRKKTSQDVRTI